MSITNPGNAQPAAGSIIVIYIEDKLDEFRIDAVLDFLEKQEAMRALDLGENCSQPKNPIRNVVSIRDHLCVTELLLDIQLLKSAPEGFCLQACKLFVGLLQLNSQPLAFHGSELVENCRQPSAAQPKRFDRRSASLAKKLGRQNVE